MSDFDENRPQGDDTQQTEDEKTEVLDEELEQIRSMFQQELDGEEIQPEDDVPETQLDDEPEIQGEGDVQENQQDDEPEMQGEPCECCGEKPKDDSFGEDYPYCADCRALMVKAPMGFKGIGVILLALVLTVISFYTAAFVNDLETDMLAITADESAQQGKLISALNGYISYFSAAPEGTVGKKVAQRAAKAYAALGYYTDANDIVDNYFTETDLKLPTYSGMKKIAADYDSFYTTYQAILSIVNEPLSETDTSKIDWAGLNKQLDTLKAADPKAADENATIDKYAEFFIEYYKYIVLVTANRPLEDQYEQIKAVEACEDSQLWAYGSNLCNVCSKLGKVDEAQALFDKVTAFNKEDATIYAALANAYRFSEKPDPDKMIEVLNKGIELDGQATESYRLLAIAYLMKGDYETAFSNASTSYSFGYTFQNLYTLAVCAIASDNSEMYDTVNGVLTSYGYDMSETVLAFKDGKLTLDEILYDAQGDLA